MKIVAASEERSRRQYLNEFGKYDIAEVDHAEFITLSQPFNH
jgi:hypothetical protein